MAAGLAATAFALQVVGRTVLWRVLLLVPLVLLPLAAVGCRVHLGAWVCDV